MGDRAAYSVGKECELIICWDSLPSLSFELLPPLQLKERKDTKVIYLFKKNIFTNIAIRITSTCIHTHTHIYIYIHIHSYIHTYISYIYLFIEFIQE